jgi:ABC-type branched-subunit amino acid transport system ATPase component
VVVEHDMAFIEQLGGKVTVLHEGSVLAEGDLATVQNDQRVIEVYLGAEPKASQQIMLKVENLNQYYGGSHILRDVSSRRRSAR